MICALQFHWLKSVLVVECTIETPQINEDRNVIAAETFGGNLKQSHSIFKQFLLCIFCTIH